MDPGSALVATTVLGAQSGISPSSGEFWSSPLVWVALAVLANLAIAVVVLAAFRRGRRGDEPPSD